MLLIACLLSFLFLLWEGSVSSLPLLLVLFLCLLIVWRKIWIFPLAFATGVLVDVMQVRVLGETSLFLMVFLFLILLYERKYETDSVWFVVFASFLGSFAYLLLFGYRIVVLQSILCCFVALVLYIGLHLFKGKHGTSFNELY